MPTDINVWSQFGLPGLIILAFLVGWGYLGKYFIDKWRRSDDEKQALLVSIMGEAKNDRDKFTATIERISEKTVKCIDDNTKAIHELSNEIRKRYT